MYKKNDEIKFQVKVVKTKRINNQPTTLTTQEEQQTHLATTHNSVRTNNVPNVSK
jgi:hypothetical protein